MSYGLREQTRKPQYLRQDVDDDLSASEPEALGPRVVAKVDLVSFDRATRIGSQGESVAFNVELGA
jgi:hypothetical protein